METQLNVRLQETALAGPNVKTDRTCGVRLSRRIAVGYNFARRPKTFSGLAPNEYIS